MQNTFIILMPHSQVLETAIVVNRVFSWEVFISRGGV